MYTHINIIIIIISYYITHTAYTYIIDIILTYTVKFQTKNL